jgi:hypothetical protein
LSSESVLLLLPPVAFLLSTPETEFDLEGPIFGEELPIDDRLLEEPEDGKDDDEEVDMYVGGGANPPGAPAANA